MYNTQRQMFAIILSTSLGFPLTPIPPYQYPSMTEAITHPCFFFPLIRETENGSQPRSANEPCRQFISLIPFTMGRRKRGSFQCKSAKKAPHSAFQPPWNLLGEGTKGKKREGPRRLRSAQNRTLCRHIMLHIDRKPGDILRDDIYDILLVWNWNCEKR